jgi:hypothetical protein
VIKYRYENDENGAIGQSYSNSDDLIEEESEEILPGNGKNAKFSPGCRVVRRRGMRE